MNLAQMIYQTVLQFPERLAMTDGRVALTYRELHERSMAVARFFRHNGLNPGDRVLIWLPNVTDAMVLAYATWWVGGVFVPLNTRFSVPDLLAVLDDAQPRFLFALADDRARLEEKGIQISSPVFWVGDTRGDELNLVRIVQSYSGLTEPLAMEPRWDHEAALLMYTSGTTGRPKGVIQTQRNNTAAVSMVHECWQISHLDRFLVSVPLFHVGGMQCAALPALTAGAAVSMLPRWSAEAWVSLASAFHPTITALVTTMLVDLIRWAEEHTDTLPDLSSLRVTVMGGSSTPPAVVNRFQSLFGIHLIELYGETELTGLSVTYRAGEAWRVGSMGKAQSQVLDTALYTAGHIIHPLAFGITGELLFRGETISPGYWNQPDKTQERHVGEWFRTGDMVSADDEGYLYYRDRVDDMIVTGGENVFPAEVEAVLSEIPGIRQVAVIGTPHPRWGEEVSAFIVPQNADLSVETIRLLIENHPELASYKRPRRIELVASLPTTGSGKINKAWLKKQYSQSEGDV